MLQDDAVRLRNWILALIGALTFGEEAQAVVGFGRPQEWTDSVSFSRVVFFDVDGNGVADAAGIDRSRGVLAACPRLNRYSGGSERRILAEVAAGDGGPWLVDMDRDGRKDLVCQQGSRLLWWKSVTGQQATFMGARDEILPQERTVVGVEDIDGDGWADLRVHARDDLPFDEQQLYQPGIGFGNSDGSREWLWLPDDRWTSGSEKDEMLDFDGDGDLDWYFADLGFVWRIQERGTEEFESFGRYGILGNFDDAPGVEWIFSEPSTRRLVVRKRRGPGDWYEFASAESPLITQSPGLFCKADTKGNGRDELFIAAGDLWTVSERIYRYGNPYAGRLQSTGLGDVWLRGGLFAGGQAVDSDGDGREELVIQVVSHANILGDSSSTKPLPLSNPVSYLLSEPIGSSSYRMMQLGPSFEPTDGAILEKDETHGPGFFSIGRRPGTWRIWGGDRGIVPDTTGATDYDPGDSVIAGRIGPGGRYGIGWRAGGRAAYGASGRWYSHGAWSGGESLPESPAEIGSLGGSLLGAADFDGDGIQEVLMLRPADGMMVWRRWLDADSPRDHLVGAAVSLPRDDVSGRMQWIKRRNVVLCDIDGDQDIDVIHAPSVFGNRLAAFLNDGTGKFETIIPIGPVFGGTPVALAAGDIDEDGKSDLVVSARHPFSWPYGGEVVILCDRGRGEVKRRSVFEQLEQLVVADFDGNGREDIIASGGMFAGFDSYYFSDDLVAITMEPGRILSEPMHIPHAKGAVGPLFAADWTGDGIRDLIQISEFAAGVWLLPSEPAQETPAYADWDAHHPGGYLPPEEDEDGDGQSNLLEYAAGTDPRNSSSTGDTGCKIVRGLQRARLVAGAVIPRKIHGACIEAILETSADMESWGEALSSPRRTMIGGSGHDRISWELQLDFAPGFETIRFYRLRLRYFEEAG